MVAVKTLRREAHGADQLKRFRGEAVATALLEHPNIVPVHELAATSDGDLLLAMKLIDGVTWRAILHPRSAEEQERSASLKWTLPDHLEVLLKVCDGMAFAHARGVLHADLKPDNVMIGDYGEVLITDWGCAVAIGPGPSPLIPRPQALRSLRGSPAYMAPEVASGRVRTISTHTDIFLLGATLYEVLTGTPPYRGTRLETVLRDAAHARVEPPSRRAPERILPEELCQLAMEALSLEPTRRPRSVRMFAARLTEYRRHAAAIELAEAAKAQLAQAGIEDGTGDEHYKSAIAFCERGLEIWPERQSTRQQLAEAQLGYASFALTTRAFHLASAQAASAARNARASGRLDLLRKADGLAVEADRSRSIERQRQRQMFWLRCVLAAGVALCTGGLLLGLWLLSERGLELARSERLAIATAHSAEAARSSAMDQLGLMHGLGPRFLARARQDAADQRWQDAADDAGAALASEPRLGQARLVRTAALALLGHVPAAQDELRAWQHLAPRDPEAQRASALLERLEAGPDVPAQQELLALMQAGAMQDSASP